MRAQTGLLVLVRRRWRSTRDKRRDVDVYAERDYVCFQRPAIHHQQPAGEVLIASPILANRERLPRGGGYRWLYRQDRVLSGSFIHEPDVRFNRLRHLWQWHELLLARPTANAQ